MKYLLITTVFALFLSQLSSAQTLADAYRLSDQRVNGTARAGAMGNAFGALGGDFTSLSINPAGIGIYRRGEFTFTPVFKSNNSTLSLNNENFSDNKFQLSLNNIGLVGVIKLGDGNSGIVSFNYGIGFNNVVDFNQNFYGIKNGSPKSFLDGIVNYANNENLSNNYLNQNIDQIEYRDWPTKLAWDTYLIDPTPNGTGGYNDGEYQSILYADELVDQRKSFSQSGGINEFVFTGGLNFNHQFYLGATVGIQNVNLHQITEYSETFSNNSFTFGEDYSLTGSGYNLKIGAIYKPVNMVRLGVAIHTPTYYMLSEKKNIYMNSRLLENHDLNGINLFDYNFYNPWKAIFSGAYVFENLGLLSCDLEYVDYTAMNFKKASNSADDLIDVNNNIDKSFSSVINIRLGGELKISPQFSVRGGYEFYPNSEKDLSTTVYQPIRLNNSSVFALGLGYASNNFFTDLTFRNTSNKYSLSEVQPNFDAMKLTNSNNKVMLTLGYKF